jgi:hypothetical protein
MEAEMVSEMGFYPQPTGLLPEKNLLSIIWLT